MGKLLARTGSFLEHTRATGMAPATLQVYGYILRGLLERFEALGVTEPAELTEAFLERYFYQESLRTAYGKGRKALSRATLHHERAVLARFLRYLAERRVILRNEAAGLDLGKLPRAFKRPPGRETIAKLLAAPGEDPAGLRDKAIFEMLYSTGIRRAEMCALDLNGCDRAAGSVRINHGKGGKGRLVPVGERALAALGNYLKRGRPMLSPQGPALFVTEWGRRLAPGTVGYIFRMWCEKAGINPPITPHLLRHACATHLLENGAGVRHVQAMLGHAWIGTTAIYTHPSLSHIQKELARLHPRPRLEGEPSSL